MRTVLFALLLPVALAGCMATRGDMPRASAASSQALDAAIAGQWRTPENTARDAYRHPRETLAFFGVRPGQTVIEVTPSPGWYSEILAPLLNDDGRYVAAVIEPASQKENARGYYIKSRDGMHAMFDADPAHYSHAMMVDFDPMHPVFGAPASADVVLTFRNVHNWRMAGTVDSMFRGFFDVLKPGGVLGVVEHRARTVVADDDKSGYVGVSQVIAAAQKAGFVLQAQSEINANARDTKDYPGGVWTLPPSNRHDAAMDAKYRAIGESDRMTLRFVKPRG